MSIERNGLYEFEGFRLDVAEHTLTRSDGSKNRQLPEKAFQTLCILVGRSGHLVTKRELLDEIWPDSFVEENNLDKCIHAIRLALGEKPGEQKYIETVRKHGYRFVAEVRRIEAAPIHSRPGRIPESDPPSELSNGDPRDTEQSGSHLVKEIPKSRITASGQHALVDLSDWRDVVERLDSQNDSSASVGIANDAAEHDRLAESLSANSAEGKIEVAGKVGFGANDVHRVPNTYLRWLAPIGIIVVLVIAGVIGADLWRSRSQSPSTSISQKRLTVGGGATRVAISKDGRYAAVAQNAALILFDLNNGGERVLVPASRDTRIMTIAFHPDVTGIYFGTRQIDTTLVSLYRISLGGGDATKILDDIYGSLSFSPDNKKIAFIRRYPELNEYALLTADADGSNITKLASSRLPNRFDGTPAWSPDGSKIVCSSVSVEGGFHYTIAKVGVQTGSVEFVPEQRWTTISSPVWLADSQRIVLAGQDEKSVNAQIWKLDTNTGAASRVTDDSFVYESISGTADGRSIVAVKIRQSSHVWALDDEPVQLTAGFDNRDGVGGLAWSTDGSIFYHSRANGRDAIWQMQMDGSKSKEITSDTAGGFAVSPDGRLLVFQGKQSADHLGLQRMDLTDGSQRPLTEGVTALTPAFFPDGKRVAFSLYDKNLSLFEIPTGGGQPTLLSTEYGGATAPSISPSGKSIAFAFTRTQSGNVQAGIAVIANESKQVVSSHPVKITIGSQYEEPTIQWSADESEVYFIQLDNSVSNIMKLRLSDGAVSNVTNFADGRIFNFAVEPGGKRILIARGFVERDASLLQIDQPL